MEAPYPVTEPLHHVYPLRSALSSRTAGSFKLLYPIRVASEVKTNSEVRSFCWKPK